MPWCPWAHSTKGLECYNSFMKEDSDGAASGRDSVSGNHARSSGCEHCPCYLDFELEAPEASDRSLGQPRPARTIRDAIEVELGLAQDYVKVNALFCQCLKNAESFMCRY